MIFIFVILFNIAKKNQKELTKKKQKNKTTQKTKQLKDNY